MGIIFSSFYYRIRHYETLVDDISFRLDRLSAHKPEYRQKALTNYKSKLNTFEKIAKSHDHWRIHHGKYAISGSLLDKIAKARRKISELDDMIVIDLQKNDAVSGTG